ncbi:hypothetical protein ACJX0J_028494 [Zea mays]
MPEFLEAKIIDYIPVVVFLPSILELSLLHYDNLCLFTKLDFLLANMSKVIYNCYICLALTIIIVRLCFRIHDRPQRFSTRYYPPLAWMAESKIQMKNRIFGFGDSFFF